MYNRGCFKQSLSQNDYKNIANLYFSGKKTQKEIARLYRISQGTVSKTIAKTTGRAHG